MVLHDRIYVDFTDLLTVIGHVLTWGYMSKKDIAISSEWGNRRCTHFMTLTYFTPEK
jgi:hypothetical protein